MANAIRIAAPAKLNLFLHILSKRADGYHAIQSLAAFTELADWLEIEPSDTISVEVTGNYAGHLASMEDNLVWRAANALKAHYRVARGAHIVLHKMLPVGAGLGGGSSDAAAALLGLARLWHLEMDMPTLLTLGLALGSDIPVCLGRKPSWMSGIGEELLPVDLHELESLSLVLVNPGKALLTAEVYRSFRGPFSCMIEPLHNSQSRHCEKAEPTRQSSSFEALGKDGLPRLARHDELCEGLVMDETKKDGVLSLLLKTRNDLETPAIVLMPEIEMVLQALNATRGCCLARMSGSGATCFGLYTTREDAEHAVQALRKAYPLWWVQRTSFCNGAAESSFINNPLSGSLHGQAQ